MFHTFLIRNAEKKSFLVSAAAGALGAAFNGALGAVNPLIGQQ